MEDEYEDLSEYINETFYLDEFNNKHELVDTIRTHFDKRFNSTVEKYAVQEWEKTFETETWKIKGKEREVKVRRSSIGRLIRWFFSM